jgi:hypothetical protein
MVQRRFIPVGLRGNFPFPNSRSALLLVSRLPRETPDTVQRQKARTLVINGTTMQP